MQQMRAYRIYCFPTGRHDRSKRLEMAGALPRARLRRRRNAAPNRSRSDKYVDQTRKELCGICSSLRGFRHNCLQAVAADALAEYPQEELPAGQGSCTSPNNELADRVFAPVNIHMYM